MSRYYSKSKLLRRGRAMWGSYQVWRMRLVFWLGALAIGAVSVGFARLADVAQHLFSTARTAGEWTFLLPLVITPLGFVLCAWLAMQFFPNAQGSGIPQAIAARHLHDREDRARLLNLKLAVGKIVLTITGLLSGASIGREGPTVQVGASIMLQAARWGGVEQARGLILAGSAAGIAAAFNTPLAGIVFAIEEMSRSYESRTNGAVLTAVILAGIAALGLNGNYTYFGGAPSTTLHASDWWMVMICGIGGGLIGAIFSTAALRGARRIKRWAQPDIRRRMLMLAGASGLAIALLGILSSGATFGTGYEQARAAVEGTAPSPFFFLEKLAATFISMMSGIPGGIFAPSLSVGAGFGSTVATLLGASISLGALVGMAGYFAGVVQAPMTAFVIILEMSDSRESVIALMAASMLGYIAARFISSEPLYHGLSRAFIADSIRANRANQRADVERAPAR
ncbi:chloride channel protein [Shinella sp. H4-D48]|uniref:chloride channel protein n=1 Tax=Shinella sp. H4-D48 TaxID=2925841 RepID=UPI001F52DD14|nr:chloride channel protein [Shinella sp. H4-D48]UNK37292.1 chloride channel protein [Shinella sp. H4-D48]